MNTAAASRAVAAVGAVLVVVLLPSGAVVAVVALAAAAVAIAAPARVGGGPFVLVSLVGWAFGYGRGVPVPFADTVAFALLLYAVHLAVALAAAVPPGAAVTREVLRSWVRAAGPPVVAIPVVAAVAALVGRPGGAQLWDVVGVAGGLVVLGCVVLLARTARR